jgi:hypothetical protein
MSLIKNEEEELGKNNDNKREIIIKEEINNNNNNTEIKINKKEEIKNIKEDLVVEEEKKNEFSIKGEYLKKMFEENKIFEKKISKLMENIFIKFITIVYNLSKDQDENL